MEERISVPYPIIVEGRYDKLRLESVIDARILTTDGFGLFNKKEKAMLFRALAEKTPLVVLTDSDGAGKLIRSHLSGILPPDKVIHLYVPRIEGKEKRKSTPSAEGVLGVEGMERQMLHDLFAPYAAEEAPRGVLKGEAITKTDLYQKGLTGKENSQEKRNALGERLVLPPRMTPNAFLAALNVLLTREEFLHLTETE